MKGVDKYHKVPKSSIRDILDDYSSRADRQLIYTAKIDVN